jgi:phenylalanyl-tRNA synthetase beta chain
MKISREWLQTYFDTPLPPAEVLADALTFHAFEIESVEADVLDVKVTPNRGHDCLSYRGIAKEISAILSLPITPRALEAWDQMQQFTLTMPVSVHIAEPELCPRYVAWTIKGVKVGPSPEWLVKRLAAMGQQSINNVVDATNYVMFNTGQPLHAFDAGKLKKGSKDDYAIEVRKAHDAEKLLALDNKEYTLKDSMLVIVDAHAGVPVGIAGVKGGMPAGITEETQDVIIESANFNGASVRKTAQALKLRTDASQRFEQALSPELPAIGIRSAAKLILELAGGELSAFSDSYPKPQEKWSVSVSLEKINRVLGTSLNISDVEDIFKRLGFSYTVQGQVLTVEPPFERLDLKIPEDLVEEVGRIHGYENVAGVEMPAQKIKPEINANYASAEKLREELVSRGYSEVFTSVFSEKGERAVANKVDGDRPFLRSALEPGLKDAYERNVRNKDLLGLDEVRLFEIGTVWTGGKEEIRLAMADKKGVEEEPLAPSEVGAYDQLPTSATERYKTFSRYPFIVRDIALWVPFDSAQGKPAVSSDQVLEIIRRAAGDLAVRCAKFDEFKKGDKQSYAFRLVFQSMDRTLMDEDANSRMESVYAAVRDNAWEVR